MPLLSSAVLSDSPDLEILRRAAAGDAEAAERVARSLLPRVRNLVRYLARGDSEVDDIAQEALVAVLKGLGSYRAEGSFESWADRIVARTTFAELKRRNKLVRPRYVERYPSEPVFAPSSEAYLERRRIVAVLDRLPEAQREVLVLHHALELSVPEIAAMLATPIETIRSRLKVGRREFRRLWGEDADAEGERPLLKGASRA
jgi:RNA polymerase sigma-70 factor, ECF subfamily